MDSEPKLVRYHKISEEYGLMVGDQPRRTLANGDVAMWFDPVYDIEIFHGKFHQYYNGPPRFLPEDLQNFRRKFSLEEHNEWLEAIQEGNLAKAVDSLIDKIYVDLGTLHLMGIDTREAWRRVHRANMGKEIANPDGDERSHRDAKYDIVKPEGWMPPNHDDLVG